jgi:hypothetical protein
MLTLHGKGTLEREFRKRLVRLDQSTENNGANGIPFYMKESDTLRGIVNSGSGHAFVSGSNVLLSPSEGGMMVILLVEKSDEGGTIVPFGCYVTPDPGGLWARLRRATFNQSLPLRFSLNNETKPRVIVGLDGANKPWACEVTADDSSV